QELPEGPWQVTTKLTIDPEQKFQQGGLLLYNTDTHYAKFNIGRATPGHRIELVYHRDGENRLDQYPPEVHQDEAWLRLTSDGEDIRASVSYDGETFERYGRDISVAEAGFTHIGPFAFRGSESTPEIEATFDWFRFSPDADTYDECLDEGAEPDTTALAAKVDEAKAIELDAYTEQSVAALRNALPRAEEALAAAKDQAQVDDALAALEAAINGLETMPAPEPTPEPTPDPEPTDPEPTEPEPIEPPSESDRSTEITVDDATVRPGDPVEVRVTDAPGTQVKIGLTNENRTLTTMAVVDGTAEATVIIPEDLTAGTHRLQARAADGSLLAEVAIEVLDGDGELPLTGAPAMIGPLAVAAVLLSLGGAVMAIRRRHT
ncbi:DUF1349 domain-containing protein, partial [Georgenia halophila]|uniref:beta-xylosidase family glycoside hydrolase n=1 Tax=Georgenia halophila TaxID=620889 RepID=UPI0031EFD7E7